MTRSILLIASALTLTLAACKAQDKASIEPGTDVGIVQASMNKAVVPGDDFFSFANGTWVKNTALPEDRSALGGFTIADIEREKKTEALFQDIIGGNPKAGSNDALIADYYRAYLNTDAIDRAGMAPAKKDLDAIAAIKDVNGLSAAIGRSLRADVDPMNATNFQTPNLFGIFVTQGLNTPGETLPYILQGGIGMPERQYYLSADPKMAKTRDAYRQYIATVMRTAGRQDADQVAARILALETKIAQAHEPRELTEDYTRPPTVWTRAELEQKAPGLNWGALLDAAQLGTAPKFEAYNPGAIPRLSALVKSAPIEDWKDWLAFQTLNAHANVLPKPIRDASFAFYGTELSGIPKQRTRDKLALNATSGALQDAVGKAYVDKYFPASAKAEVEQMVANIKAAFAKRVKAIDWLAPTTKAEALRKVETLEVGVGYPDSWRDYSNVRISADNPYDNSTNVNVFEYQHQIAKIGKPMDRREWWMPAQLVNAVNLPVQNAMNFPAAILQRPFFDPKADSAFNYGAIGSVIGHEISHSFDDNGAAFDSKGVMRNWWTPTDYAKFKEAGTALARQFDTYEVLPGLKVNGKLTLGENIADVAGLSAAYDAYKASLGGKPAKVIDGFSGDQRFFIAYAQAWAAKERPEYTRQIVLTNGHAPDQTRAQSVRNIDAWYDAFAVKPGQKLYLPPEKRVKIW